MKQRVNDAFKNGTLCRVGSSLWETKPLAFSSAEISRSAE